MLFFTTSSAPPDAEPEITLISLPPEVCQALMAGFGPTYAASSWPASRAVASSVPVLNGYSFSVTFLPRSLVKYPSLIPTSALAWVMFSRNPSRRVTGAEEPPESVVEFDVPEELDELHPAAASRIAAPAPAAISVFRIVRPVLFVLFDQNYRLCRQPFISQTSSGHHAALWQAHSRWWRRR